MRSAKVALFWENQAFWGIRTNDDQPFMAGRISLITRGLFFIGKKWNDGSEFKGELSYCIQKFSLIYGVRLFNLFA